MSGKTENLAIRTRSRARNRVGCPQWARNAWQSKSSVRTAALLDGALRALRSDRAPVTVDLTDVDHIDSHGLGVLLEAEADARARRAPMEVVGVRESLHLRRSPLEE